MHIEKSGLQPRASAFFNLPNLVCGRSENPQSALAAFHCVSIRVQAAAGFEGAKVCFVRDPNVGALRSEWVAYIWHLISDFNGCFGDVRCIAVKNLLQVRGNAASAKLGNPMSAWSRKADITETGFERLLSELTLSNPVVSLSFYASALRRIWRYCTAPISGSFNRPRTRAVM